MAYSEYAYTMRKLFPNNILVAVSFIVALGFIVDASWIHMKAAAAQLLIADAWKQSQETDIPVKPWSWADTWPVARLRSSKHNIDLYVLDGSHGQTLAFGPGRLNTPFGQSQSATVLAGHRDTHFQFLEHVEVGDIIELTDQRGQNASYIVNRIDIEDIRINQLLPVDSGLTLVTCYPFDAVTAEGPLRYVVRATRAHDNHDTVSTRLSSS